MIWGTSDFLPFLGLIKSVIFYHTIIAFLCCPLETYYFDEHYYGKFVALTSDLLVL